VFICFSIADKRLLKKFSFSSFAYKNVAKFFGLISRKKKEICSVSPLRNVTSLCHALSRHAFRVARDSILAKETAISTTTEFNLLQIS